MRKLEICCDGKTITFIDQDDDESTSLNVSVDDWIKSGRVQIEEHFSFNSDPVHGYPQLEFYIIWFTWLQKNGDFMGCSICVDKDGLSDAMSRLFNLFMVGKQSKFAIER